MFSGSTAAAPVVLLSGFMKNPVKTGFRGNIHSPVRQFRDDLARGKAAISGIVANRQHLFDFLFCQLVGWFRPFGRWAAIRFNLLFTGPLINDKYFFPLTTIKIPVSHSFLTC
jgi:hypothetical protein